MAPGEARRMVVLGVGTVGCRLAGRIRESEPEHRYLFIDTDRYPLSAYDPSDSLLIGAGETDGRGTGKQPSVGSRAAEESEVRIKEMIGEAEIVAVVASLGGGTGAGAGPAVARYARESGATAVVIALDPFAFESSVKVQQAYQALRRAEDLAEAVVRIPCTLPPSAAAPDATVKEVFLACEEYAAGAAASLIRMLANPGTMRLDFGDLRRVISEPGGAVIGIGRGDGDKRVEAAIRQACNSSFLDVYRLHSAANVLLHVAGGETLTLAEVEDGLRAISGITSDGDYLLSVDIRPELMDEVVATVLLSGFSSEKGQPRQAADVQHDIAPEGAFVYDGVNIDVPTFLRRPRNSYSRAARFLPDLRPGR